MVKVLEYALISKGNLNSYMEKFYEYFDHFAESYTLPVEDVIPPSTTNS